MPTYDYECPDCGHRFEEFQTMTAKPIRKCPNCGKRRVKRLIGSGLAPIFKGSGFYQTDYKPTKEPSAKPETGGASDKPSEAKAEPAKAETKPAQTETKPAKKK
jgi:putative FmdB family regulatory protein